MLKWSPKKAWAYDDGTPLVTSTTQQHWLAHSDALFLVYTRRGANNDHVFRHRAPLFMAQVDPKRLCIIRDTEQIIVPDAAIVEGAEMNEKLTTAGDLAEANARLVEVNERMRAELETIANEIKQSLALLRRHL